MSRSVAARSELEEVLDCCARTLIDLIESPADQPARWYAPDFARKLGLVRAHLRPIRSRALLVSSFERESFQTSSFEARPGPLSRDFRVSAVHVAYALRWLELGDDTDRPGWLQLLTMSSEETMTAASNRPNARASRARLLSARGRTRRHRAGERVEVTESMEGDGLKHPGTEAPLVRGAETDVSSWSD